MQKTRKIELIKNNRRNYYDGYTIKINDIIISDSVSLKRTFSKVSYFQTSVCDFCGVEGCDSGGFLSLRRYKNSLLFIPCFEYMDSFEEYVPGEGVGDCECPPHEFYEKGCLVIEEKFIPVFLSILSGFSLNEVADIKPEEVDQILEWEMAVLTKPVGFMAEY